AGSEGQADHKFEPNPRLTVREALDRAAAAGGGRFKDRPEVEANLRWTIGEAYRQLGAYPEAIAQFQRYAELAPGVYGSLHPDTLDARNRLGRTYLTAGRAGDAVP